ncbi:hypothetical protein [Corynebacterium sp.]|uniref:hypothetical protein n=1 Tax=Corynebacterium sp. TaxID=1720 RepID=UPI0028AECECA|nr:hypothetical protein [Corynebacterium sp.]
MTVLRLLAAGHRSASMAYLTVGALLVGLAGGIIGTAVRATGVADELRGADVVTTDTAAEWGNYQGVADYTFMVAAIACIVGMILVASAAQFLVASFGTTSRRLRMLGASRRAVRWHLTAAVTVVSALTVPLGVVLSPVAARGFRLLLERTELSTTGLGTAWTPQPALIAGICLMGWGVLAVWWQARHLAGLAEDAQVPTRRRHRRILAVPVRYGVGIAAGVGLWLMHDAEMTLENFNEMAFGIAFCTLLVVWSCAAPVLRGLGWMLRRGGTGRMVIGGVAGEHARRVAGMSLVASMVIVLGGTSAFAALTSTIGEAYRSEASLQATAVTEQRLTASQTDAARDAGLVVSPLHTDAGWLEGHNSVDMVPVHRVDPVGIGRLLAPGAVTSGSLDDLGGDYVAADDRRTLGDTVLIRDDDGEQREVTVVATLDRDSALGSGITVDDRSFPVSSGGQEGAVTDRTYASGHKDAGGVVPGVRWDDPRHSTEEQIADTQAGQLSSLVGMVGGIGVVAVVALVHAVVGFAADCRGTRTRMRRISFSWARVTGAFGGLGMIIALAAGLMAAASLWVAHRNLAGMLSEVGADTTIGVPWILLAGLWGTVVLAGVAGTASPSLVDAVRSRPRSAATGS